MNAGGATNLLLAVSGCPTGESVMPPAGDVEEIEGDMSLAGKVELHGDLGGGGITR
jgi:hypothetical protein